MKIIEGRRKKTARESQFDEAAKVLAQFFPEAELASGRQAPKPVEVKLDRFANRSDVGDPQRRNYIWMTAKVRNILRHTPPPPLTYTYEVLRVKASDGRLYVFERYYEFMIAGTSFRASVAWMPESPLNKHGELSVEEFWNDKKFFNAYDKWHRF